ncbi:hypothetical protein TNCV_3053941 [Trichonephila clavipes]|nr:hypothetical protein TNCV_3053941 [Trichonephila clavipes]
MSRQMRDGIKKWEIVSNGFGSGAWRHGRQSLVADVERESDVDILAGCVRTDESGRVRWGWNYLWRSSVGQ